MKFTDEAMSKAEGYSDACRGSSLLQSSIENRFIAEMNRAIKT
jgi:hypothetical protein